MTRTGELLLHEGSSSMDIALDSLFDGLNADLFAGRLPKYRVRRCPPQNGEWGFIDEETRTIWICAPAETRETLLHEMCHIGTPGHGRRFRAKLKQLARRGEKWAEEERAYYLWAELGMKAEHWVALWELGRNVTGGLGRLQGYGGTTE
jgi:hypothetical protein